MEIEKIYTTDPKERVQYFEQCLTNLKNYCHAEAVNVSDPKAQALFETTAEVLAALEKACSDYQSENEGGWVNDIDRPILF